MKINDTDKQRHYDEKTRFYEEIIQKMLKNEADVLEECRKAPETAAERLFELSDKMLDLASLYMALNGISLSVLNLRDENSLVEARRAISKAIIYIENIVTGKVDVPYSDYEGNLAELAQVSPEKKYYTVRKIGASIDLLKYGYGDNTKWRWSFVDVEGRFIAVAKNLLDLKQAFSNNDPSEADYAPLHYHLHLVKDLLSQQAHRYQERFSLAMKRADDMRLAINYLSALKQFHVLLNEHQEAEEIKKKLDVWMTTYQNELKKERPASPESS
ncbi:MAG: hypothetical protein LBD22_04080 [Spirochaetaceae bacterium]|jgi:hypothetical protein|nr:hypothetical protein [Spirochaetaceae bacterium]